MRIRRGRQETDTRPSAENQKGTSSVDRQNRRSISERVFPRRKRGGSMRRHPTGQATVMWRQGLDRN